MATVKVSPKFQVVIPKEIRERLALKVGEELQMYVVDGRVQLSRRRSIKELRGVAQGMSWKNEYRDRTERF